MFGDIKGKTKSLFGYSKKKHKEKDVKDENHIDKDRHHLTDTENDHLNYTNIAVSAYEALWDLYKTETGWKSEGGKDLHHGIVDSIYVKQYGRKVFRVQGIIKINPEALYRELVDGFDEQIEWNKTIAESRTLEHLDDNTTIVYNITKETAGGMVSARDFVNVRHWGIRDGIYVAAACGCIHPDLPEKKKIVRGENDPGGFIVEPLPDEADKCLFYWFVNSDLKGWLPHAIIDQAMSGVLLQYFENLSHFIDKSHGHRYHE